MSPLIDKIKFLSITTSTISETNSPLGIAEKLVAKDETNIWYVSVKNNIGYEAYAPVPYSMYTIIHTEDTIAIHCIAY